MTGAERIAAERQRQIESEGWSEDHDRQWVGGELAIAAACYAVHDYFGIEVVNTIDRRDAFPFCTEWDKREKHDELRRLTIAGALIAAEIDRLLDEKAREA